MGLKDNFYQALRELLNGGGASGSDLDEKDKSQADLEDFEAPGAFSAQDESESAGKSFADFMKSGNEREADYSKSNFQPKYETASELETDTEQSGRYAQTGFASNAGRNNLFGRPSRPEINGQFNQPVQPGGIDQSEPIDTARPEEMTVISKSTVVLGDIRSLANVTIDGKVRGNVNVLKDVTMHGVLVGDLMCNNSNMRGSSIQGNITAKGRTYIDNESMLLGDMKAQYSNVDGKVKGNLDIGSKIHLHQNAVVAGNINTNTIAVEDGANIKGFVNTSFLDENGDTAFPSQIAFGNDMNTNSDE